MYHDHLTVKAAQFAYRKRKLTAICRQLGLQKGDYEISLSAGGPGVGGETILHSRWFYLSWPMDGVVGSGRFGVLIRSCNGLQDFVGGTNTFLAKGVAPSAANLRHFIQK